MENGGGGARLSRVIIQNTYRNLVDVSTNETALVLQLYIHGNSIGSLV